MAYKIIISQPHKSDREIITFNHDFTVEVGDQYNTILFDNNKTSAGILKEIKKIDERDALSYLSKQKENPIKIPEQKPKSDPEPKLENENVSTEVVNFITSAGLIPAKWNLSIFLPFGRTSTFALSANKSR